MQLLRVEGEGLRGGEQDLLSEYFYNSERRIGEQFFILRNFELDQILMSQNLVTIRIYGFEKHANVRI